MSSTAKPNRPFSIDLSLQLERQLAMEDDGLPQSPPPDPTLPSRESLDPHVLAHIIMQLRQNLAEMTKERDDLLKLTSSTQELQAALQQMTEKATSLEEQLEEAQMKIKDDEEAINLLRSKVEESRRGLMRLQTENRRQSQGPSALDLSRAGISFAGTPSTKSAKRASFTPLTGSSLRAAPNTHRRGSSISDSGLLLADGTQTLTIPDNNGMSRRLSGMFGSRSSESPPQQDHIPLHDPETEALRKEVKTLREAMEGLRTELSEAHEAREASDSCVKALREFIAEYQIGTAEGAMKLPPLPANTTGDDEAEMTKSPNSGGWRFKLWKVDNSVKSPTASPISPPALTTAAPLTKKIGGFFSSSRGSVSQQPDVVSNSRASMCSSSDKSSLVEPLSPTTDTNSQVDVLVQSAGPSPELKAPEQVMKES